MPRVIFMFFVEGANYFVHAHAIERPVLQHCRQYIFHWGFAGRRNVQNGIKLHTIGQPLLTRFVPDHRMHEKGLLFDGNSRLLFPLARHRPVQEPLAEEPALQIDEHGVGLQRGRLPLRVVLRRRFLRPHSA